MKNQIAAAETERAQLDQDKAAELARLEAILKDHNNQTDDLQGRITAKQANYDWIEAELDIFRNELPDIQPNCKALLDGITAQQN